MICSSIFYESSPRIFTSSNPSQCGCRTDAVCKSSLSQAEKVTLKNTAKPDEKEASSSDSTSLRRVGLPSFEQLFQYSNNQSYSVKADLEIVRNKSNDKFEISQCLQLTPNSKDSKIQKLCNNHGKGLESDTQSSDRVEEQTDEEEEDNLVIEEIHGSEEELEKEMKIEKDSSQCSSNADDDDDAWSAKFQKPRMLTKNGGATSKKPDPVMGARDCEVCGKVLKTNGLYNRHMLSHTGYTIVCKQCDKGFDSQCALDAHAIVHVRLDERKTYECSVCFKTYFRMHTLKEHLKKHEVGYEKMEVMCDVCGASVSKGLISKHMKYHKECNDPCVVCGKRFKSVAHMNSHMKNHNDDSLIKWICSICGKQLKSKDSLKKHEKFYHVSLEERETNKQQLPPCKICGKTFINVYYMKWHMKYGHVEHTKMEYSCLDCTKKFKSYGGFRNHVRTHKPDFIEKPHVCSICEKAFGSLYKVERHMKQVHTDKLNLPTSHECNFCGKCFNTGYRVKRHIIRVHTVDDTC